MRCRVIVLDTTGTTYTLYEIEKRKETIEEKTETKNGRRVGSKKLQSSDADK